MATTLTAVPLSSAAASSSGVIAGRAFLCWAVLAFVLGAIGILQFQQRDFDYAQAWVAADFATMARTFDVHGIADLRGVPVNNNAPLGVDPPVYTHWPPLFPILLSGWFAAFGASEASAHGLMLLLWILNTAAIGLLARQCFDNRDGVCVTLLAWMGMPAVVRFAHAPIHLHLCVLLLLVATLCFVSRRAPRWLGMLALAASVAASWEGALLAIGLTAFAITSGDAKARRLGLQYFATGIAAAVGILAWYLTAYPKNLRELLGVLSVRMRLANGYAVDPLLDSGSQSPMSLVKVVILQALHSWDMLGTVGALALILLLVEGFQTRWRFGVSGGRFSFVTAGWAGVWLIWYSVLSHHAAMHNYEALILAPLAAFAIARLIERGMSPRQRGGALEKLVTWAFVVPGVLLFPLASSVARPAAADPADVALVRFGRELRRLTPPGAIVLTPEWSMVPVYYSGRRIVRGVTALPRFTDVTKALPKAFPEGPRVYFAAPAGAELPPDLLAALPGWPQKGEVRLVEMLSVSARSTNRGADATGRSGNPD
jgi:hypothetical protein